LEVFPALGNLGLFPIFFNPRQLPSGRIGLSVPKYNPDKDNFSLPDWQLLCKCVSHLLAQRELACPWVASAATDRHPQKGDQDKLDALICLCIALHWTSGGPGCVIGDFRTGYIVVPTHPALRDKLQQSAQERDVAFLQ
jgi:predicted RNase H-like nuclease